MWLLLWSSTSICVKWGFINLAAHITCTIFLRDDGTFVINKICDGIYGLIMSSDKSCLWMDRFIITVWGFKSPHDVQSHSLIAPHSFVARVPSIWDKNVSLIVQSYTFPASLGPPLESLLVYQEQIMKGGKTRNLVQIYLNKL